MKHSLFFVFSFIISTHLIAQSTYSITGLVKDLSNKDVPSINALLIKSSDSSLVKGAITSKDGAFMIDNVSNGNYLILCSSVGFQSAYSKPFTLNKDYVVETILLKEGEQLDEVLIEATKPLYEQKVDRMVINVESSIVSAGGSALEILERSPGVVVNRQSNAISVIGKDGVVVMINGKVSYVPSSALVQMLEGMSSDNIESIELITTPPANLDAEGNAGFINIVLKKRTNIGLNGSYSLSAGYGEGETTSDNINFNYRKKNINLFGSYSYALDKRKQQFITNREYTENGNPLGTFTESNRDPRDRNHNLRFGLDIETSEKTIMGVLLSGYDNQWTMDAFNKSFDTENGIPTSYVDIENTELNHWKNFWGNYNLKHNFTKDQFLSFDIDYLYFKDNNPTNYTNTFYDEDLVFTNEELLRSGKITPIKTWVTKLDYTNKINDKVNFEMGIKGTKSNFENDVSVEDFINNSWVIDASLTNKSNLDEKIIATYGSLDYKLNDKISMKFGLRYEYTDSQLDTDTQGKVVDRQFGIFFPSLFFNKKFSDDLNMNLSYSKRITRPTFNELAPFVILFDPNTFISGNTSLQPAISNSVKYDFNYKSYILSFQYTNEESSIAKFQERIDQVTDRLIFEATNLEYTKTFSTTIGLPIKITDWWKTQNNLTYISQKVSGMYNGEPVKLELGNFSANSTHSFKFTKSLSAEISAFYTGPSLFGTAKYNEVYRVNIGLQNKFNDKWGTLRFSVNDIFDSFKFVGGTNAADQNLKTKNTFDFSNRSYILTYSRNFGNRDLKSARDREAGATEERRRVD